MSDAFAERVQAISDANRKRERLVAHSRGQAEAIVMNAKAKARERLVQAESSAGAFLALLAEYRRQPAHVGITRYWQRMREIFSEASLAAVNPGNQSSIDINMIDGAGFTPADMALAAPPAGDEALDRPLLSSATMQDVHTIETGKADRLLFDGQFHRSSAERDHMSIANPRSLIFDTPSIFRHRHVRPSGGAKQEKEKPMVEEMAAAEEGQSQQKEKE